MKFYKLSGAGNDFIALPEAATAPSEADIQAWCQRGLSIGADGLFLLDRIDGGLKMVYFNADGRRAELCLNGTRCAAQLASQLGWIDVATVIHTDVGAIPAQVLDAQSVRLDLAGPEVEAHHRTLTLGEESWDGWCVTVGNPHFVVFREPGQDEAEFDRVAPLLRRHSDHGAAGANVHFVSIESPESFSLRSFERGVEAETLACGTGVLAAVAALSADRGEALPISRTLDAHTRGGVTLNVAPPSTSSLSWSLAGDARLVFEGELRQQRS